MFFNVRAGHVQQVLDDSAATEVVRWRRCSSRTDPLVRPRDGTGTFTIPRLPIRRRLPDIPPFVITRCGEYCFAPGLRGLRWLADLTT